MDKSQLEQQAQEYFKKDFQTIYNDSSISYELLLQIARLYINSASDMTHEDEALVCYDKAHALLDKKAIVGKDDPLWLFYKGYSLFKQNLIEDAIIRLQRALKFVDVNKDGELFEKIYNLYNYASSLTKLKVLTDKQDRIVNEHYQKYFGEYKLICQFDKVQILEFYIKDKDYYLYLTKGLSAYKMVNDKAQSSIVELSFISKNPIDTNFFALGVLKDLISYIYTNHFVGFGFTSTNDKPYVENSNLNSFMLCALGDFDKEALGFNFDNDYVSILQIIFLYPQEYNYRFTHSSSELIDLFKLRNIKLSPININRENVLKSI